MTDETIASNEPWDQLEQIIDTLNPEHLAAFLQLLPPEDTAYTISRLGDARRTQMLSMLSAARPEFAADLMEHFADEHAADMLELLAPKDAAAIVDQMDSDEQTDVLGELDEEDAEAILARMDPAEAIDARQRLRYEPDTAGGLMITEYLAYRDSQDVEEVVRDLREHTDDYGDYEVRYLYVIDDENFFKGVAPMRRLVAPRGRRLIDLMIDDPIKVEVGTPLDALQDLFDRVHYTAVPVLDERGRMVGVVEEAAVQEAVSEQVNEDLLKVGGIIGGEELRSMPFFGRAVRRLAFLLPILLLLLISASIIAIFEPTVKEIPILAAFLPVVAGLCGSGGNQAVAVSMREISLGLLKPVDFWRVLSKEAGVALMNGLILGVVVFVLAWIWRENAYLGLVVGGAIPLTILIATGIGGGVPVLLSGIGLDPAMASGPIVTTAVDLFSFLIVLTFASLWLIP